MRHSFCKKTQKLRHLLRPVRTALVAILNIEKVMRKIILSLLMIFSIKAYSEPLKLETLIEYLKIMKVEQQITSVMNTRVKPVLSGMLNKHALVFIQENSITNELQKQAIYEVVKPHVADSMKALIKAYHEIIPYDDIVAKVYYPAYQDTFTEQELQNLISFFNSPVGQKFIFQNTVVMEQAALQTEKIYGDRIGTIYTKEITSRIDKVKADMALVLKGTNKSKHGTH